MQQDQLQEAAEAGAPQVPCGSLDCCSVEELNIRLFLLEENHINYYI